MTNCKRIAQLRKPSGNEGGSPDVMSTVEKNRSEVNGEVEIEN